MNISLDGKRALVTGGNSGIGAAIAKGLSEAGAKVAINYVAHGDVADQMARDIWDKGREAITVEADISKPDDVEKMFAKMDHDWGGVDILINNAGIDGKEAKGWDLEPQDFEKVIEINLLGSYYCAREALKRMTAQKSGVVLSTSSVHEMIAWTVHSAYTATKAGVGMMNKTLAQEAAPFGVRVLSIGPGAIKTPINKNVWDNKKGLDDLLEKIPMKRMGTPEDIAKMAVVLVSDIASYVTGRTIYVDGGMTDYPDFSHGG
jgi:NAD(P)-dependent dehydrogenase (short-subunit alcohol dehydrogenase family)